MNHFNFTTRINYPTRFGAKHNKLFLSLLFLITFSSSSFANTCATANTLQGCGINETGSTTGEPNTAIGTCITAAGTGGMQWYTFTGDGFAWTFETIATAGQYDTKIWVFSGSCGALTCVTGNDDGGTGTLSLVNFTATVGVTYYVIVGGFGSAEGNYELSVNSVPCNPLPMVYTSSTVTQNGDNLEKCANNAHIVGVEVVTSEVLNPLDLTALRIRTNGSTAPLTDVSNIDVYYTGTSATFATTTLFGSAAPLAVGNNITVNGNQTLATGTNYFWVVYDLAAGATTGNNVDALCNRITVDGANHVPTIVNPAGNRTLVDCPGDVPCTSITTATDCGPKTIGTTTGFGSSGIAAPSCGNYQGGDVWYNLIIPASGEVDLEIKSTTTGVNDLALAAYTATSCSSTLTLAGCDDNGGIGNMPLLNLTGLTAGDTLFVRIWEPGNDQSGAFELECTDGSMTYCLNNDATTMAGGTCYQLTADATSNRGSMWHKNTVNFDLNFDYTMDVYFGTNDGGADGITFVFHNDPAGSTVFGTGGGGIGAEGISNALIIEMDTWDNGVAGFSDISDDHIAISTSVNGMGNPLTGAVAATVPASNIEDGNVHQFRMTWNATTHLLEVYFDGVFRLSVVHDFVTNVFGSNNVFFGTTASTGGASNQHYVCPVALILLPVELAHFDVACADGLPSLTWSTNSETNNAYFEIERSLDGVHFESIGTVNGNGTTTATNYYDYVDANPIYGSVYYRLKQVDFNGKISYSKVIEKSCQKLGGDGIHVFPNPFDESFTLNLLSEINTPVQISIMDYTGKLIAQKNIDNQTGQIEWNIGSELAKGVYILQVDVDGARYVRKLIKN